MNRELNALREHFGRLLAIMLWAHVPLMLVVAWLNGQDQLGAVLASAFLAAIYQLNYHRQGVALSTRYIGVVAMMAEPALLVFLMRGHPWQMDLHMYFFAMLALTIAWFDRRAILLAAVAVALHHLVLLYLLPYAVFPEAGTLSRVMLHAGIVAFQTAVLVWLADMISDAFDRIRLMNDELLANNQALALRSEEAEKANNSKSMFLANMSHEIRTPLNAVLGFCHLLQRTPMTPRQDDYVAKIGSAGSVLLRLINDILDLSKNEAGKLSLETAAFSPHAVIEQQFQMVLETAKSKGLVLDVQKDPILPMRLVGDELRFGQVILNLVNNAVKFTERGSVTVRTRMQSRDATGVVLAVEVIDTGIGMTAEQSSRLFASFTQADDSMTRRYGGTGLGLAISKQIVELMGGQISVQSEPWVGTILSFTVRLGLDLQVAVEKNEPHKALRGMRILTVDDNPASRQLVQDLFGEWQMAAEAAGSGTEALERLEGASASGRPFDFVLLDWKMPGMDGLETVKAVAANPRIGKKPKMVLVTAYGSDAFTSEVEAAGVSAYLPKPLEARALISTLEELFAQELRADMAANPGATAAAAPMREPPKGHAPPMVSAALQGLRVLLVEDNEINREIAIELLTDAGLLVDSAENGQEALDRIAEHGDGYSMVLMDLQMPVMDGLEATKVIRKSWSAKRLPIVAMTAHAYADERQRCLDIGMNDHVAKPVEPNVLVATLERWLTPDLSAPLRPLADVRNEVIGGELPERLPPFGLARALERVNGKKPLLRRLIINFAESQAGFTAAIQANLDAAEYDDARRAAHTLKGLAGSLELPELQAAAAELERRLRDSQTDLLGPVLALVERHLQPAVTAGRSLTGPTPAAAAVQVAPVAAPSGVDPAPLLQKLHGQLVKRSLGARASFTELAAALGMDASAIAQHPLYRALERLDYVAALNEFEHLPGAEAPRYME